MHWTGDDDRPFLHHLTPSNVPQAHVRRRPGLGHLRSVVNDTVTQETGGGESPEPVGPLEAEARKDSPVRKLVSKSFNQFCCCCCFTNIKCRKRRQIRDPYGVYQRGLTSETCLRWPSPSRVGYGIMFNRIGHMSEWPFRSIDGVWILFSWDYSLYELRHCLFLKPSLLPFPKSLRVTTGKTQESSTRFSSRRLYFHSHTDPFSVSTTSGKVPSRDFHVHPRRLRLSWGTVSSQRSITEDLGPGNQVHSGPRWDSTLVYVRKTPVILSR